MSHYFTAGETAKILDIGYRTLIRWITTGRFGHVLQTPTQRYRVSWNNIEQFCSAYGYPMPRRIPKPQSTRKQENMIDVDSPEGRALLGK